MTDLLPPSARDDGPLPPMPEGLPAIGAAVAGVAAAGSVLLCCAALALAGWFASDAGSHGDTRDAIRVGADAWLLAHGAHLELSTASISVVPLGLTLFCAYVTFRLGRWAGTTAAVEDVRGLLTATAVLAGMYAVVTTLTAVLASLEHAQPHLGLASVGGFVLAAVAGGPGLLAGSGRWPAWRGRVPDFAVAVGTGAASVVLLMLASGALLVTLALALDLGPAANVLSRLHADASGGLLYTVVVAAVAPNAALLAGSYLLGPGFMVGTGTLVSPSAVVLGPVPAFPLLAALPDEGATPWWTAVLVALPVLLSATAAALMLRRHPVPQYELGAARGLAAGVVGAAGFTLLAGLAGGSAGPGRMADIGALLGQTALAAVVAMGVGGLVGGVAATWWLRRGMGHGMGHGMGESERTPPGR